MVDDSDGGDGWEGTRHPFAVVAAKHDATAMAERVRRRPDRADGQ